MFPWVYGFRWSAGHLIFLSVFFCVLGTVVGSVVTAALRSARDIRKRKAGTIQWEADFEDLPRSARACRHELAGEVARRTCEHGFDCRTCTVHPEFLSRASASRASALPLSGLSGLAMPLDRMYHRGHAWMKPEADGSATLGLDDFGARLIGRADGAELPLPGTRLEANGCGWYVLKGGERVRILSPVDCVVLEQGGIEQGWLLRVEMEHSEHATRHLLRGGEVAPWILREIERLELSLGTSGAGATLADGGEIVADLPKAYPEIDWASLCAPFFLEP